MADSLKHYAYLDALRGMAILGVLVIHCSITVGISDQFYMLFFSGREGVELFYVVSAFTLFNSMEKRSAQENHPTLYFFIRRFFRIAPLFYTAIIINLLYQGMDSRVEAPDGLSWLDLVLGFTLTHGFYSHSINAVAIGGWSVGVEAIFYMTLPLLFWLIKSLPRAVLLLLIAAPICYITSLWISMGSYQLFWPEHRGTFYTFLWFPIQFPVFCMGIIAYFLSKKINALDLSARSKKMWSFLLVIIAIEVFVFSTPGNDGALYSVTSAFVPFLLGLSLYNWKIFVNPFTVFIGKISFSMYLLHFFVLISSKQWFPFLKTHSPVTLDATLYGFVVMYLGVLACTVAISWITYSLIEQPGIKAGKRLIAWIEKRSQRA